MANNEDMITLEIEGTSLSYNKNKLINNSDYFKVLLDGDFLEHNKTDIQLKEVKLKSFNDVLALIDKPTAIPKEDILDVLITANYLQFEKITKTLSDIISTSLSINNCLEIWRKTEPLNVRPLYQVAKSLALKNFLQLKDDDRLLDLTIEEITKYLGDIQLKTDNELTVIKTVLRWWLKNKNETQSIFQLLHCISFSDLEVKELEEFLDDKETLNGTGMEEILHCILNLKQGKNVDGFSKEVLDTANNLKGSKRRLKTYFPLIFVKADNKYQLVYYDTFNRIFKKFTDLDLPNRSNKFMINVVGYGNRYICILVKRENSGIWDLWIYDKALEKLDKKATIPYEGNQLKSTIIGNKNYITDSASFLVIYNLVDGTFSERIEIPLHKEKNLRSIERHVATFNFRNEFVLLSTKNNWAYFYRNNTWHRINVDVRDFDDAMDYFSHNDRLYLQDDHLVELAFKNNTFVTMSSRDLMIKDRPHQVFSAVVEKKIYTLYFVRLSDNEMIEYDLAKGIKADIVTENEVLIDDSYYYQAGDLYFIISLDNNQFVDNVQVNSTPR